MGEVASTLVIILCVALFLLLGLCAAGMVCTWRRHGPEAVLRLVDRWCGWTESSNRGNNREYWR